MMTYAEANIHVLAAKIAAAQAQISASEAAREAAGPVLGNAACLIYVQDEARRIYQYACQMEDLAKQLPKERPTDGRGAGA